VIVAEKAGEVRYLLSDGLGSIRQAVDETGAVVAYYLSRLLKPRTSYPPDHEDQDH
jgi:hypothetical protein